MDLYPCCNLKYICSFAAVGGQLALIQWAFEHRNIRLDSYTFAAAAKAGNFPIMKWLSEHGCSATPAAWSYVATRGM